MHTPIVLHLCIFFLSLSKTKSFPRENDWNVRICFLVSQVKLSRQKQVRITELTELRHALGTQPLPSLNVIRWVIRSDVHRKWLLEQDDIKHYNPVCTRGIKIPKKKGIVIEILFQKSPFANKNKKARNYAVIKNRYKRSRSSDPWTDVRNLWLLISSRLPVCLFKAKTGVPWRNESEGRGLKIRRKNVEILV